MTCLFIKLSDIVWQYYRGGCELKFKCNKDLFKYNTYFTLIMSKYEVIQNYIFQIRSNTILFSIKSMQPFDLAILKEYSFFHFCIFFHTKPENVFSLP